MERISGEEEEEEKEVQEVQEEEAQEQEEEEVQVAVALGRYTATPFSNSKRGHVFFRTVNCKLNKGKIDGIITII